MVAQVAIGLGGLREAWPSVGRLAPGLVAGIPIGISILGLVPPDPVRLVIGCIVGASVLLLARGARLPPAPSRWLAGGIGLLGGVVSGLASMGGPPIIVYLLALGHPAAVVRATAMIYFALSGFVSMLPMIAAGLIDRETWVMVGLSLPALFLGSWLGTLGFRRTRPWVHKWSALSVLSVLSIALIARSAAGLLGWR